MYIRVHLAMELLDSSQLDYDYSILYGSSSKILLAYRELKMLQQQLLHKNLSSVLLVFGRHTPLTPLSPSSVVIKF